MNHHRVFDAGPHFHRPIAGLTGLTGCPADLLQQARFGGDVEQVNCDGPPPIVATRPIWLNLCGLPELNARVRDFFGGGLRLWRGVEQCFFTLTEVVQGHAHHRLRAVFFGLRHRLL